MKLFSLLRVLIMLMLMTLSCTSDERQKTTILYNSIENNDISFDDITEDVFFKYFVGRNNNLEVWKVESKYRIYYYDKSNTYINKYILFDNKEVINSWDYKSNTYINKYILFDNKEVINSWDCDFILLKYEIMKQEFPKEIRQVKDYIDVFALGRTMSAGF